MQVLDIHPTDAAMYANQSICWLRMRHGDKALEVARKCRKMQPRWPKAWYREGVALSFMKVQLLVSILPSQSNPLSPLVYTSLSWYVIFSLCEGLRGRR
jgi:hypothetical protein